MQRTLTIWLQAIRPKTLSAGFCPVALGTSLAIKEGRFDVLLFLFTLLTALGIQIGTNLANDYFDFIKGADTSARKGPVRVTQAGLVKPETMQKSVFLCFALTALCSSYLILHGGVAVALLSFISIMLGLAYTAGPVPLAYLGLGDFFVLLFFGPVATAGTYYLQTHMISTESVLLGLGLGCVSTAILTANNLRDIDEDRKANKKTLCVRFGLEFGQWEYILCLLMAMTLPLFVGHFLPLLMLPPVILLMRSVFSGDMAPLLPKTSLFLLVYTVFMAL
jgi:1,4-dihydroxy-2-naphthoate octaprenyltransferase